MSFRTARSVYGRHTVLDHLPEARVFRHVTVWNDTLYDALGSLVRQATYCRGVQVDHRIQIEPVAPGECLSGPVHGRKLSPDRYLWLGYFHHHFGHFLLSTLQRLWGAEELSGYVVLTPTKECADYLKQPFVSRLLKACGVRRMMYVSPGTEIEEVLVPEPAFVETSHVYRAWGDFMERIARIAGRERAEARAVDQPLYLSRHRLAAGTRRLVGEDAVVEHLARRGVRIESPEALSIEDQIGLWRTHTRIIGYNSSAMHGAAFAQGRAIGVLSHGASLYANQTMIDHVRGHRAWYMDVSAMLDNAAAAGSGFDDVKVIGDPRAYAEAGLRLYDHMHRSPSGMRPARSAFLTPVAETPFEQTSAHDREEEGVKALPPDFAVTVNGQPVDTVEIVDEWAVVTVPTPLRLTEVRLFGVAVRTVFLQRRLGVILTDGAHVNLAPEAMTEFHPSDGLDRVLFRWEQPDMASQPSRAIRVHMPHAPACWTARLEIYGIDA